MDSKEKKSVWPKIFVVYREALKFMLYSLAINVYLQALLANYTA